jgi:hypothetical protein
MLITILWMIKPTAENPHIQPFRLIPRWKYAPRSGPYVIGQGSFYESVFNSWLNLHRPCLFATEVVSDKGKVKKVYKNKDAKTPLERLVQLSEKGLVTLKAGIALEDLLALAKEKSDLQAAQEMQKAKADLFELFNKPKRTLQA